MATLCCCPPDSSFGLCPPLSDNPTTFSAVETCSFLLEAERFVSNKGISTFLLAVKTGSKL